MSPPTGRPVAAQVAGQVLGVVGLVVLLVGTFLPWLDSGQTHRNSYEAGGALKRLLGLRGATAAAVTAWPLVALVCAAVVVLFAVGWRRSAATLASLTALATGAVAFAALRVDGNSFVRPVKLGPTVTLVGATALLVAVTLVLMSARTSRSSRRSTI